MTLKTRGVNPERLLSKLLFSSVQNVFNKSTENRFRPKPALWNQKLCLNRLLSTQLVSQSGQYHEQISVRS
jgi:hypothetical protein